MFANEIKRIQQTAAPPPKSTVQVNLFTHFWLFEMCSRSRPRVPSNVEAKLELADDDHCEDTASTLTCSSPRPMPSAKKPRRFEPNPSTKEEVKSRVKDCKAEDCSANDALVSCMGCGRAKGGLHFDTVSEITWAPPS